MKRIYSLKGRSLFREVYNRGAKLREKNLGVITLRDEKILTEDSGLRDASGFRKVRIGINISKKVGKAYLRNRIRRRLKSICGELLDIMNEPLCVIIRAEKGLADLNYGEMKGELVSALRRAKAISENRDPRVL